MTREVQKRIEVFYAEEACKILDENWEVKLPPDEKNWPDLIITTNKTSFGLEVRELYLDETKKGSPQKSEEVFNKKKMQKLAKLYYKENKAPISVKILGDMSNEKEIINAIVVNTQNLSIFEHVRVSPYRGCTIFITKVPEEFKEYKRGWSYISDHGGWVGSIKEDTLEKKIELKSTKLYKYKTNISDVRLLLVGDRHFKSGLYNYMGGTIIDKKGFNKVYFLSFPFSVDEF